MTHQSETRGQIRCYTWRRSTLGAVQRWDARAGLLCASGQQEIPL